MVVKIPLRFIAMMGFTALGAGADGHKSNYFINPSTRVPSSLTNFDDNIVYSAGSALKLSWETNFTTISLVLRQQGNDSYSYLIQRQPVFKTLMWVVDLNGKYNITSVELEAPNVFSLELWEVINDSGQTRGRFSSQHFNITGAQPITEVATSPPTPNDSNGSLAAITTERESTTEQPASNGLSLDAKISIGIGVGLGVLCLAIAAAVPSLYFWGPSRDEEKNPEMLRPPLKQPVHLTSSPSATANPTPITAR
ncbi:hypothetical protein PRZ48_003714 [Zasmidium cellare]|uniref:Mid2 domain-containing protein n=1 Tax=Zasmidium cellare TaxID=395010 RepID=A0ABR0EVV4_ZASCE|nr:hypothetical protein PRZ48_003714 [Zasmidium cellare]